MFYHAALHMRLSERAALWVLPVCPSVSLTVAYWLLTWKRKGV